MTQSIDYYEVLQVSRNAERAVIEAAYRRLARIYHPDVNRSPDAEERMQRINEAFYILGDAARKADYDRDWGAPRGESPHRDTREQTARTRPVAVARPTKSFSPFALVAIVLIVVGVAVFKLGVFSTTNAPEPGTLSVATLQNMDYLAENFVRWDGSNPVYKRVKVRFLNGEWKADRSGPSIPMVPARRVDAKSIASGDMNGDGLPDSAVIVIEETGGTAYGVQLHLVLNDKGVPRDVDMTGMSGNVDSLSIQSATITAKVLTWGANDAHCCPSVPKTQRFRLSGSELVEIK